MGLSKIYSPNLRRLNFLGFYLLVFLLLIPFIFPFFWMVLSSIKNVGDVLATPPKLIFTPTFENYQKLLSNPNLYLFSKNSVIVAFGSSLIALVIGLPAAYSIARYRQGKLSSVILLARILPMMSVLLPWFIWFTRIGIIDTLGAVILAHLSITLPLTVWIMISFFEDLEYEIEDAALVDGCSKIGVFYRISIPLTIPGMTVSFLLSFIFSWNNFLLSSIVGGGQAKTLPVLAYGQISWIQTDIGAMAAAGIILTFPVLILTLFVQKYLIRGLSFGGVKG